ncbi:MAG: hypothetical protein PWR21_650 [Methanoculleus sp.]|nr:hypothetical protein [Methanoculleus sp.]MDK2989983.1 hypothetical protein [Methanoculleus sp.]
MQNPDPIPETTADVPTICHTPDVAVTRAGKRIVLLIAVLAGFLTPFDGSAVNIALPAIGTEFHMDAISLSWIATAYLLAAALFLVPFGKIADIYGRKRILLYGIVVFTLSSFVMTVVPTTNLLIAVRILQGFGGAMIFGTSVAILTSVFPPGERGKALGIYTTAVYFGLTIGPFLGGLLTEYLGWRSIFFINVPIGIIACILILWKFEGEWAECVGERFDLTGSVTYACALIAVMYGLSIVPDATGIVLIAAGIILGIIFALYEMRIPMPVLKLLPLRGSRSPPQGRGQSWRLRWMGHPEHEHRQVRYTVESRACNDRTPRCQSFPMTGCSNRYGITGAKIRKPGNTEIMRSNQPAFCFQRSEYQRYATATRTRSPSESLQIPSLTIQHYRFILCV